LSEIIHILPAFDLKASGPSYLVLRLCESIISSGMQITLVTLDWLHGSKSPVFVKRFPIALGPKRLGRSPLMLRWLIEKVKNEKTKIIHNHGLWTMPNIYSGYLRTKGDVKLVISPHGTMSEWTRNYHRWRKWIMWHLGGQKKAIDVADAFHATAEDEYHDIRRIGCKQPVAIIPSGIDIPPLIKCPSKSRRIVLFLGRIHKKKGIDLLLKAWSVIEGQFQQWDLIISGPNDQGYLSQYQSLASKLALKRVQFIGPLYDEDKLNMYRKASIYVLPTHSENFGITVAESLAAGTPVIVTKGAPWSGVIKNNAGWWIDIGIEPLVECLKQALSLSEEQLIEMGKNGREWMIRDYSWETIGKKMIDFYNWLLNNNNSPDFIKFS